MARGVAAARASSYYIDCRVVTLSPDGLALVARLMADIVVAVVVAVRPGLTASRRMCRLSAAIGRKAMT
jgi:hypothetical protein